MKIDLRMMFSFRWCRVNCRRIFRAGRAPSLAAWHDASTAISLCPRSLSACKTMTVHTEP
jgi:hypothetical protein